MELSQIKPGDVFLTRSDSFLSQNIINFMMWYAKQHSIVTKRDDVYSHAGYFEKDRYGRLIILEAVENGFKPRLFERHYQLNPKTNCVLRPKRPWTDEDLKQGHDYAYYLAEVNWGYQYWNFIQWISSIALKNEKAFEGDNNKWLYCFEAVYRILNAMQDWRFPGPCEQTSIFRLYDLKNFNKL